VQPIIVPDARNDGQDLMVALRLLFLTVLMAAGFAMPCPAHAEGSFFEALYDIPVMPGLEEIKGEAMLFDKPDGRIASVVAASKDLSPSQVGAFYAESLPQLGWRKTKENQYVRDEDQLTVEVSRKAPLTVVHFTLSPLKP
jgi:hypothetical protein